MVHSPINFEIPVEAVSSSSSAEQERAAGVVPVAAWQHLGWLRAGFSTREGGQTSAYNDAGALEQNLGWTPEDPAAVVAGNRRAFISQFHGFGIENLVTIRQLHGSVIRRAKRGESLATGDGKAVLQGDGLITSEPGLLLGIQTADCVPVLLADTRTHAVGAFHAGWRGTLARIVEAGVAAMHDEFGSHPEDLVAAIGPAIGSCCFKVGEEVRTRFYAAFSDASELFSEVSGADVPGDEPSSVTATASDTQSAHSQIHLDLWQANRRQLLHAGVAEEAITIIGECTACTHLPNGRRRYFSHRAERGYTGRMLSVIGVPNV